MLWSSCSSRRLRAVKSVRATMDSIEPLLRSLPNFRVIHLLRDPRAVALSRMQFAISVRGLYTTSKVVSLSSSSLVKFGREISEICVRTNTQTDRHTPSLHALLCSPTNGGMKFCEGHVCLSVCLSVDLSTCMSVCLSASLSEEPHVQTSPNFPCRFPVAVVRFCFSAVCGVFSVLW